MHNWLKCIRTIIHNHFVTNGKNINYERLFTYRFSDQLWQNIRNFLRNLLDLPVWANKDLSVTVFGGKQNYNYWEVIFEKGSTPQNVHVLAQPLNLVKMIQREEA